MTRLVSLFDLRMRFLEFYVVLHETTNVAHSKTCMSHHWKMGDIVPDGSLGLTYGKERRHNHLMRAAVWQRELELQLRRADAQRTQVLPRRAPPVRHGLRPLVVL